MAEVCVLSGGVVVKMVGSMAVAIPNKTRSEFVLKYDIICY